MSRWNRDPVPSAAYPAVARANWALVTTAQLAELARVVVWQTPGHHRPGDYLNGPPAFPVLAPLFRTQELLSVMPALEQLPAQDGPGYHQGVPPDGRVKGLAFRAEPWDCRLVGHHHRGDVFPRASLPAGRRGKSGWLAASGLLAFHPVR
ncbi:MAG: hypothetical protein Q8R28_00820 [Dehalococcoidia bacterium]|nr:hypothetical protein [Dehalococcoidia bacterium]